MNPRAESCPPDSSRKLSDLNSPRPPVLRSISPTKQSVATQGAVLAFSNRHSNSKGGTIGKSRPGGADAAAVPTGPGQLVGATSSERGRILPAKTRQDGQDSFRTRSSSTAAAQIASAKASPVRKLIRRDFDDTAIKAYAAKSAASIASKAASEKNVTNPTASSASQDSALEIASPYPIRPLQSTRAAEGTRDMDASFSPPGLTGVPVTVDRKQNLSAGHQVGRSAPNSNPPRPSPSPRIFVTSSRSQSPLARPSSEITLEGREVGDPTKIGSSRLRSMSQGQDVQPEDLEPIEQLSNVTQQGIDRPTPKHQTKPPPPAKSPSPVKKNHLTESGLADAIVAWSVASRRAQTPSHIPPHPPPFKPLRHRMISHYGSHDSDSESARPSRPPRPMKHTLRKHVSDDDKDTVVVRRGRKHLIRKHQHKHHEGDRKRWRDKVTERERARYEGVWAANRGMYFFWSEEENPFKSRSGAPSESDRVLNLVVRDIWERSRLSKDVLEEVWDLVASPSSFSLSRDEFVVGMWLLDQRLKGKKLPRTVSQSVWSSVRHTKGLKISSKPLSG